MHIIKSSAREIPSVHRPRTSIAGAVFAIFVATAADCGTHTKLTHFFIDSHHLELVRVCHRSLLKRRCNKIIKPNVRFFTLINEECVCQSMVEQNL